MTTASATQRRELHFDSLDEVLAEAERLAAANEVATHGNWSLGQILMHLARAVDLSIDGADFKVPFFVRLIGPLMKRRIMKKMPSGFKLSPAAAKKLAPADATTTENGLAALRRAIERLSETDERKPHVVFGATTREEWNQIHLRHAEMHMSFVDTVD